MKSKHIFFFIKKNIVRLTRKSELREWYLMCAKRPTRRTRLAQHRTIRMAAYTLAAIT